MKIADQLFKKKSRLKESDHIPPDQPLEEDSGNEEILSEEPTGNPDEIVSIEEFIKMKKRQNKVLEKIIETINQSDKKV